MKTYQITLHYLVSCTHEVEAKNETEALESAQLLHYDGNGEEQLLFSKDDIEESIEPIIEKE